MAGRAARKGCGIERESSCWSAGEIQIVCLRSPFRTVANIYLRPEKVNISEGCRSRQSVRLVRMLVSKEQNCDRDELIGKSVKRSFTISLNTMTVPPFGKIKCVSYEDMVVFKLTKSTDLFMRLWRCSSCTAFLFHTSRETQPNIRTERPTLLEHWYFVILD